MSSHNSSKEQKISWLVSNPSIWKGWPIGADPIERQVFREMQNAGLISLNTNFSGTADLGGLIGEARKRLKKCQPK